MYPNNRLTSLDLTTYQTNDPEGTCADYSPCVYAMTYL